jgi:hypothetical protein
MKSPRRWLGGALENQEHAGIATPQPVAPTSPRARDPKKLSLGTEKHPPWESLYKYYWAQITLPRIARASQAPAHVNQQGRPEADGDLYEPRVAIANSIAAPTRGSPLPGHGLWFSPR